MTVMKHRSFWVNTGKQCFTVRVTEHWARLLKEVEESPTLEILRSCLQTGLGNRLWVALLEHRAGPGDVQRSVPTSAILRFS